MQKLSFVYSVIIQKKNAKSCTSKFPRFFYFIYLFIFFRGGGGGGGMGIRGVLSMCMQVILDSLFGRPGSGNIGDGKKGEFRDWTSLGLAYRRR